MGSPLLFPRFRAFDANGDPLAGGKVYTYEAGSSTALATYADGDFATLNANPVILDANGEADIFGFDDQDYKIILTDANDVEQWSLDDVTLGAGSAVAGSSSARSGGINLVDNGSGEANGKNRPLTPITSAGGGWVVDRWYAHRGGQTGYTVTEANDAGPNGTKLVGFTVTRDNGNADTTPIVLGQHAGGSNTNIPNILTNIIRAVNPHGGGLAKYLVLSAEVLKGAGLSGGVTLEIVTAASDVNICTGTWTVEASTTLTAAQLSTSTWTRLSVAFTGQFSNGSAAYIGWRVKHASPSGTASSDYFYVSNIKAELSSSGSPTAYELPTVMDSLERCRRFYRRSTQTLDPLALNAYGAAGQNFDIPYTFSPPMAKTPTATVGTFVVSNCGQPTAQNVTYRGFTMRAAVTALGAFSYALDTNQTVVFDAETA